MSPWLFNMFIDGVLHKTKARTLNSESRDWEISALLSANDPVLLGEELVRKLVREFHNVCKRRNLEGKRR